MAAIERVLRKAGCRADAIDLILPIGGMVEMPAVRDALTERFAGRVADVRRYSRGDRLIAEGAGWLAADGVRLELSKALDVEEADGEYGEILPAGAEVPEIDARNAIRKILYCVDTALGEATIRFALRKGIGAFGEPDVWRNLNSCLVPIVRNIRPFVEKIEADVRLDRDCIAQIAFQGSVLRADPVKTEVIDLEFGIALPWRTASNDPDEKYGGTPKDLSRSLPRRPGAGLIRLRSNIAAKEDWRIVPGEVVKHFEPHFFDVRRGEWSKRQLAQYFAHERCRVCKRRDDVVWRDGCPRCAKTYRGRTLPGGHLEVAETNTES
jgi:molecular chaperone DnaK